MWRCWAGNRRSSARCGGWRDAGGFDTPLVITGAGARFMAAEQAGETGVDVELALEPVGRDTLAAITLGAMLAARAGAGADGARAALRSSDPRPRAVRAGGARRRGGGPRRGSRRLRAEADRPVDGLRLHPARGRAAVGCAPRGGLRGEAGGRARGAADRGGLPLERRHVRLRAEAGLAEIRALAPETFDGGRAGARRGRGRPRRAPARPELRRGARRSASTTRSWRRPRAPRSSPAEFEWSDIGDWRELWALSEKDAAASSARGRPRRST